jgi:hypothetical protein
MSVAHPADETRDAELLVVLPHDVAAFEAFYDRDFAGVTAFATERCTSAEDVGAVVAQTFGRHAGGWPITRATRSSVVMRPAGQSDGHSSPLLDRRRGSEAWATRRRD